MKNVRNVYVLKVGEKMSDLCNKAVFDYMYQNIKCGIDGRIVDSRCQQCIKYENTDNGIEIVNRRTEE